MNRQRAHELLDQVGPSQFSAVAQLLEVLANGEVVEPLANSLAKAPVEEEAITEQTAAGLDLSRTSLARGEGILHAQILQEFSLNS